MTTSTERALLLMAYALRLNTTNPDGDQEWPTDPWEVMTEVREALRKLCPVESAVCAALAIMDAAAGEEPLYSQDALIARFNRLVASGSPRQP